MHAIFCPSKGEVEGVRRELKEKKHEAEVAQRELKSFQDDRRTPDTLQRKGYVTPIIGRSKHRYTTPKTNSYGLIKCLVLPLSNRQQRPLNYFNRIYLVCYILIVFSHAYVVCVSCNYYSIPWKGCCSYKLVTRYFVLLIIVNFDGIIDLNFAIADILYNCHGIG